MKYVQLYKKYLSNTLLGLLSIAWLISDSIAVAQIIQQGRDSTAGTEFVLAFQPNYISSTKPRLVISAERAATGTVEVPGLGFVHHFSLLDGEVQTIEIPNQVRDQKANTITHLAVVISTDRPVHVYGINTETYSSDAFLGLPQHALGNEYWISSYTSAHPSQPSQMTIAATEDNTEVTITPYDWLYQDVSGRAHGQPFTLTLNRGQTYHLTSSGDLTGSYVLSSAPIAVYGGVVCANIPKIYGYCDHITDMLPPTTLWGMDFFTVPLALRSGGDLFRVMASQDNTTITIDGVVVATVNAGKFHELFLKTESRVQTSAPALLTQFATGSGHGGYPGDPFMMIQPPAGQYLSHYIFATPEAQFTQHFVNIVIPQGSEHSLLLDGQAITPLHGFKPIANTGYVGAQIRILEGGHTITADKPFGLFVYGYNSADSYGYAGGMSLKVINPKVRLVNTISTDQIDLDASSFSIQPKSLRQLADKTEIVWEFPSFTFTDQKQISYDLLLKNPQPGEQRLVSQSVDIYYQDVNGNEVKRSLGEKYVTVRSSQFTLDITTDKAQYLLSESVIPTIELGNIGTIDADNLLLKLRIIDEHNVEVAQLTQWDHLTVVNGSSQTLVANPWTANAIQAGFYYAEVSLYDANGQKQLTSKTKFELVATLDATLRVTTDAASYAPNDIVTISALSKNITTNQLITAAKVKITVRNPVAAEVFNHTESIGDLPANAQSLFEVLQLPPQNVLGTYTVQAQLEDGLGTLLAQATTVYQMVAIGAVLNTSDLEGQVNVAQAVVTQGDAQSRNDSLHNKGATPFTGLKVALILVDDQTGDELTRHEETLTLNPGVQKAWQAQAIPTRHLAEGDYVAAILVETAPNQWQALSVTQFHVQITPFGNGTDPVPLSTTLLSAVAILMCLSGMRRRRHRHQ